MKRITQHLVVLFSMALLMAFVAPPRAAADDDDPPGRVARLGYTRGNVSFEPAGTDDWVNAVVNRPLTTGDKLWNDNDAMSELQLGTAFIRLGSNTGFSFLNLTDNLAQIRLTEGTLNIRVRRLGDDETFEVDTPNLAFTVLRAGNYKINVNENGDTTLVIVRDGQGEVTGGGSAYTIHPREVATFVGGDQISADVQPWDNSLDDFDSWCDERDRRIEHSVSSRYVSDDVTGYEDLDEYGGWRSTGDYGEVWFPHTTIVGWAPYHYGHWAYIAPWGYTWVDDAPWGFAPFHYGRWVFVGGVWGWVPVPPRPVVVTAVYVRPVYAPALVAWVGGPHFAVGVAVGGGAAVGWFPLGPREVYVPSYRVSRTYVTNVNVSNTTVNTTVVNNYYNTVVVNKTTVTNVTYVNQRVPGGVTACSHDAFTTARPVDRNVVAVNAREVATAPVAVGAPAIAPSRQAVLGTGATARVQPRVAFESRAVVAKTAPPPPPVSFARQQQMIQANGGRPVAVSEMRQAQPQNETVRPAVKIAPAATPQNIQANRGGGQPSSNRPLAPVNPNNANDANNRNNPNNANNANNPNNPNRPGNPGNPNVTNTNVRTYNDRPPANRQPNAGNPANVNPQLEQQHQQQQQNLHNQQDLERQKLEQQQLQERNRLAQQAADQQRQQQLNQKHEQQLQNLEQKHDNQKQQLEQKQLQQDRRAQQAPPPKQANKPAKEEKEKEKDKKPNK